MFVDWAHVVKDVTVNALPERLIAAGFTGEAERLKTLTGERDGTALAVLIEVEDPPADSGFMVCTPLCFKLAGVLAEGSTDRQHAPKPTMLADLLAEGINSRHGDEFTAAPSPSGHVNGNPTASYIKRFLLASACDPVAILYDSLPCGLVLREAPQRFDAAQPLTFNWMKLEARAEERAGDEKYELRSILARAQSAEQRRDFGAFLVLLGLLSDDDFSLRVYAKGVAGRENVPWYLDRFRSAARSYSELCDRTLAESAEQTLDPGSKVARFDRAELQELIRVLLHFRGKYRTAVRMHRPEFLLAQMLRSVRAFFLFYNRPEFRTLDRSQIETGEIAAIRQLTGIVEGTVNGGTELLYRCLRANPCDKLPS